MPQWPQLTVNFSQEPTRVASVWITSVVRPPPLNGVRQESRTPAR